MFQRCKLVSITFTGSELLRMRLSDVVVEHVDLSGVDLDESWFTRAVFRNCRMSGIVPSRCNLCDVTMTDCRLEQANMRMTRAKATTFEDVDLREGDFYAAVLEDTGFYDCNFTGTEFSKASLKGVRFHGSDLRDLKGGQYLGGSTIDSSQVLALSLGVLSALGPRSGPDPQGTRNRRARPLPRLRASDARSHSLRSAS